ncbi:MAG: methyltransferase domain-containing protein [Longimicrobiaceae bacterium]
MREIRRLPGYPRLRVVDLSCGRGEILSALARDGCTVRGSHYRADDYKLRDSEEPIHLKGIPVDEGVDLMKPLPYDASSFEVVILTEVVEHLFSHAPLMHEVGRVLKPGGWLVLSTPNLHRLHSRWHFFWTGTHKLIRRRVGWDLSPDDLYAYHIGPVDFPLLHTVLYQAGLKVGRVSFTRFKPRHGWLLLLYPLIWFATRLEVRSWGRVGARREGEADLFRWLVHPALLASEQLLVTARKQTSGV